MERHFTGYRRHVTERYSDWIDIIPKPLQISMQFALDKLESVGASNRRLKKLFNGLFLEPSERKLMYFLWSLPESLKPLLNKRLHKFLVPEKLNLPLSNLLREVPIGVSELDRALLLEQNFFMPNHNLLYTDRMSMAMGVEVRVPFLDPNMLELAAEIPNKFLYRRLCSKWILKKAMEGYLPKEVIYRKKTGFGVPMRSWILSALDPLFEKYLSKRN